MVFMAPIDYFEQHAVQRSNNLAPSITADFHFRGKNNFFISDHGPLLDSPREAFQETTGSEGTGTGNTTVLL